MSDVDGRGVPCLAGCCEDFSPCVSLADVISPGSGETGIGRGRDGTFAKTCFETAVGEWSARTGNNPGSLLVFLVLWHFDSCAHNPEVVGSSPASATIKTPDFERNPVFF